MSRATVLLLCLALGFAALELGSGLIPPYGLFHDELYYWIGSKRLELGYVDHPPLACWVLAAVRPLLGDGKLAFRLVPSLCAAGTVVLTGLLARRFGAGQFGQLLAGLCIASAPFTLVLFSFYSVNALEILLWTATSFLLVELIRTNDQRLWLALGTVAGLALLNKHTYLLLGFGLTVGVVATPLREHLRRPWPWVGVAIALLLSLPNLYWNLQNGWPSLAFYASRDEVGNLSTSPLLAAILQVGGANPATVFVWVPGLLFLFLSRGARPYRALAIAFLTVLTIVLFSGQRRADRIAGAYPIVMAAGAAYWDQWQGRWRTAIRWILPTLVLIFGLMLLPATLPVLPPESVACYFNALGQKPEIEPADVGHDVPLYLLGRLNWESFADEVIEAWATLPPDERGRSVILTPHWVFASVIEYYGRDRTLPPVVAPHNAYYFWRHQAEGYDSVVAVAIDPPVLQRFFGETRMLRTVRCQYCAPFRTDLAIVQASSPHRPLVQLLTDWRHFGLDSAKQLRVAEENG